MYKSTLSVSSLNIFKYERDEISFLCDFHTNNDFPIAIWRQTIADA